MKAACRATERIGIINKPVAVQQLTHELFIQSGNKLIRIELARILYIEECSDSVAV